MATWRNLPAHPLAALILRTLTLDFTMFDLLHYSMIMG